MRCIRCILPLVLVAATGCGSGSSSNDMQAAGADLATSSCSQTVDAYCSGAGGCVRDLATAQQPSAWCPDGGTATGAVTLQHCAGGRTVIVANYVDTANHFVYSAGVLVAVFTSLPHASDALACVAGPPTIGAPSGCDAPTTLCAGP